MSPRCRPLIDRLIERIEVGGHGECWEWRGPTFNTGYGAISAGGRSGKALLTHRVVWQSFVGELPEDMTIDHLCMNRRCQNPDHLEMVSRSENPRRGALHRHHGRTFWEG